ncbi:MAG: VOC family protein [Dehalococcoidia bacterium]|nr:VOC family protein [Dehalococcoidia bacterium]
MTRPSIEFPADNIERARLFYEQVFGWRMQHLPEIDYTLILDPETESTGGGDFIGGITARNADVNRTVVPIITVTSIAAHIEKAEAAGGKILTRRTEVGEYGFSSYLEDSEGNVICLWEDATPA